MFSFNFLDINLGFFYYFDVLPYSIGVCISSNPLFSDRVGSLKEGFSSGKAFPAVVAEVGPLRTGVGPDEVESVPGSGRGGP